MNAVERVNTVKKIEGTDLKAKLTECGKLESAVASLQYPLLQSVLLWPDTASKDTTGLCQSYDSYVARFRSWSDCPTLRRNIVATAASQQDILYLAYALGGGMAKHIGSKDDYVQKMENLKINDLKKALAYMRKNRKTGITAELCQTLALPAPQKRGVYTTDKDKDKDKDDDGIDWEDVMCSLFAQFAETTPYIEKAISAILMSYKDTSVLTLTEFFKKNYENLKSK
jgi:hypothetical protein